MNTNDLQKLRECYNKAFDSATDAQINGQNDDVINKYIGCAELLQQIIGISNSDQDLDTLAHIYRQIYLLQDDKVANTLGLDVYAECGKIWLKLFKKYKTIHYRKLAESVEALPVDNLDYTSLDQYLNRSAQELSQYSIVLGHYDFLQADDGELLMSYSQIPNGDKKEAFIFCDGKKHALLFKGPYSVIVCDCIHPKIARDILTQSSLLVAETDSPEPNFNEYMAKIITGYNVQDLANKLIKLDEQK